MIATKPVQGQLSMIGQMSERMLEGRFPGVGSINWYGYAWEWLPAPLRIKVGAGQTGTSESSSGVYYYWPVLIGYLSGVSCAARLLPLPARATGLFHVTLLSSRSVAPRLPGWRQQPCQQKLPITIDCLHDPSQQQLSTTSQPTLSSALPSNLTTQTNSVQWSASGIC